MNYAVKFPDDVLSRLRSFGLQRNDVLQVLNFLHFDVAAEPDTYLKERVSPNLEVYSCPFSVAGQLFVFFIYRDDYEASLIVVSLDTVNPFEDDPW